MGSRLVDPRLLDWNTMKSRILSGLIAVTYLPLAYCRFGFDGTCTLALFLVLPLSCIWFSNRLGSFSGGDYARACERTKPTPGCLVAFGGWLTLLLPAVVWVIIKMGKR